MRYAAVRARIRPYGEQSRFFLFCSPKNPLTVCLCRVPKIGGLINSSNYGLPPLNLEPQTLLPYLLSLIPYPLYLISYPHPFILSYLAMPTLIKLSRVLAAKVETTQLQGLCALSPVPCEPCPVPYAKDI